MKKNRRKIAVLRQARQVAGAGAGIFLFTTVDQLGAGNVLIEPVWWQVGRGEPISLLARAGE